MDIDTLDGLDLDLAIEKYIFDREKPEDTTWFDLQEDGSWIGEIPDVLTDEDGSECFGRSWSIVEWPPKYHESDYLAFQVVDKVVSPSVYFNHMQFPLICEAEFYNPRTQEPLGVSRDKSRPTAICRAALKVVMNEQ